MNLLTATNNEISDARATFPAQIFKKSQQGEIIQSFPKKGSILLKGFLNVIFQLSNFFN
jgi:hypothetical protein